MRVALLAPLIVLAGCARGPLPPATLDAHGDTCAFCRMAVSASGVAAQLVAPGEDPLFFDDIGCLASFLKEHDQQPAGAIAYVADRRIRQWVSAYSALYTRVPDLETPMGSHLVAHADEQSRRQDAVTARGSAVTTAAVFGDSLPQTGSPGPGVHPGRLR